MGRLHGLVNDRQQLGGEGIEVDVIAQPDAERLDRLDRVVLAAVEAPVISLLDAAAGRLERCRHGQGRAGHRPAWRLGAEAAEDLPSDPYRAA